MRKKITDCKYIKDGICDYKDHEADLLFICKNRKKCVTYKRDQHVK